MVRTVSSNPKQLYLTLDPALKLQIEEFQRALGLESPAEAIRVLLRKAIAATPMDDRSLENIREGYGAVRRWAFNKLREKLAEIEREMNENGG